MNKIMNCMPQNIISFHSKLVFATVALSNKAILRRSSQPSATIESGKIDVSTMINIFTGGQSIANNLDFRKFMITPVENISGIEARQMCNEIYCRVESILRKYGRITVDNSSDGFSPNLSSNEEALAIIVNAIKAAGYEPGKQFFIAIDAAASSYFGNGEYNFTSEGSIRTPAEMVEYYSMLITTYPIIFIKDILTKEDYLGWNLFNQQMNHLIKMITTDNVTIDVEFSHN